MSDVFPLKHSDMWTATNSPRTRSLFEDECLPTDTPVASLERSKAGHEETLHKAYIAYCVDDPSETNFIDYAFGGDFRYWKELKNTKWMQPYLDRWKEEADIRRKAKAFKTIIKEIDEDGKNAVASAKFLISEPYKGRSAAVKKQVSKTTEKAKNEFAADIHRLKDYAK